MWPLGNLIGNNSDGTSLEQLFRLMIDQYGWAPEPQTARRRLMVFAFAPRESALNKAIHDTFGHWNWTSKESWDLLCPGFGINKQWIGLGRRDTDLLDIEIEFSEKSFYSFVGELSDVLYMSRMSTAGLLRDILGSSEGGLLLVEARVGDANLVIDWATGWMIDSRKIKDCGIDLRQIIDVIERSQQSDKNVSPIEIACQEVSALARKIKIHGLLSRVDPVGAIGTAHSVIPLTLS